MTHETGYPELNALLMIITAIFAVLGISAVELDIYLAIFFKLLSCISVILLIIINWDKGWGIIKNKISCKK